MRTGRERDIGAGEPATGAAGRLALVAAILLAAVALGVGSVLAGPDTETRVALVVSAIAAPAAVVKFSAMTAGAWRGKRRLLAAIYAALVLFFLAWTGVAWVGLARAW